jgi:hypothetical protein
MENIMDKCIEIYNKNTFKSTFFIDKVNSYDVALLDDFFEFSYKKYRFKIGVFMKSAKKCENNYLYIGTFTELKDWWGGKFYNEYSPMIPMKYDLERIIKDMMKIDYGTYKDYKLKELVLIDAQDSFRNTLAGMGIEYGETSPYVIFGIRVHRK